MARNAQIESAIGHATWVERAWYFALAVSTIFHLSAIAATSFVPAGSDSPEDRGTPIASEWGTTELKTEITSVEPIVEVPLPETSLDPGGSTPIAAALAVENATAQSKPVELPQETPDVTSLLADLSKRNDLAQVVGPVRSGKSKNSGAGKGNGDGSGNGSGGNGRFFETEATGKRFVFVVDGSRSMNHPYPGDYKTRFNRVKIEIGRSITQMDEESEYYIIFFNDKAIPMPAESFQPVRSESRARYFQWLASLSADGMTDPRPALVMALKMKPDAIYFLTDGDFQPDISRDLESLVQRDVAIHTFSLANPDAEKTLRAVAEHNSGEYTFVP